MSDEQKPDDLPEEEDFASMLEASYEAQSYEEGQTVEGRVVSVGKDVVFIDVGGKGEATIDLEELVDPDGNVDVQPGDIVQAVVVSTAGGLKLSHKLAKGAATRERLLEAFRAELPVEGRIEKSIKGGYEVRVGGQRAFCPISQIDTSFTEDPTVHEGQLYTFRITEFDPDRKNLVVSRRALLEEEEAERAEEVRATLLPGTAVDGRVASIRDFGAFIDLGGGIQGLLHVSQMGWSRVSDPSTVVQQGQAIRVQVLEVDRERDRISLGLKQLEDDPWADADETYEVGQVLMGTVTRLSEFGAFVEFEPGIEGLAHVSTFPREGKRDGWKEQVPVGANLAWEIVSFEPERRRIGINLARARSEQMESPEDARETAERRKAAAEDDSESFGSLADKLRAVIRPDDEKK